MRPTLLQMRTGPHDSTSLREASVIRATPELLSDDRPLPPAPPAPPPPLLLELELELAAEKVRVCAASTAMSGSSSVSMFFTSVLYWFFSGSRCACQQTTTRNETKRNKAPRN